MTRRQFLSAASVAAFLRIGGVASAQDISPTGGAAGGPALTLENGDILGVRNIQGGSLANPPESLNLDIGAGSTANPGDISLNYDVGRNTKIFDGQKNLVAVIGQSGIWFAKPPRIGGSYRSRVRQRILCWRWWWRS